MSVRKGQIVELSRAEFKVGKTLGSGGFGKVYLVNRLGRRGSVTRKVFALKVIRCDNAKDVSKASKEVKTLYKVKHENIVRLFDFSYEKVGRKSALVFLLTEYCPGGDLNRRLRKSAGHSLKLKWLYQLASAINYLHSRRPKIVHRDLKPANVLLTKSDDIKVADFGLARQYEALKQLSSSASIHSYYMKSGVGTRAYLAPEVLCGHYTEKVDIFSLGIVFYAILEEEYLSLPNKSRLYGAFVNPGDQNVIGVGIAMYYSGDSSPTNELCFTQTNGENYGEEAAEKLREIILDCLMYEQKKRPKARQICGGIKQIIKLFDDSEDESDSDSAWV